jgi:hypothetical protein
LTPIPSGPQRRPLTGYIRSIPCRSSGQTLVHLVGRLLAIGRELDDPLGIATSLYHLGCLAANEAFFAYTEEKLCQDDLLSSTVTAGRDAVMSASIRRATCAARGSYSMHVGGWKR